MSLELRPAHRGADENENAGARDVGPVTGCDLSDVECLCPPMGFDAFGRWRPAYSPGAARLSLELADMTYSLDLEPWARAGWYDMSIQIDNALQSGLTVSQTASGEAMLAAVSASRVRLARAALGGRNPFAQLLGALRQRERSDTIKAVVMAHPAPEGRVLVAIGFMGTGKRFYDWFSNFRFTTENGFHKGFYQLCEFFERSREQIVFPGTAALLGLDRLTLDDVLRELCKPDSRFRLWMAGHSQGGAVMQVFTHRLVALQGAMAQNIVGYGFASPTTAVTGAVRDPAGYPLYHILNSDDMVPRMGASVHLGLCLRYPADERFRAEIYGWSDLPADRAARETLFPYVMQMVDTPSILMYGTALLRCLMEERGEEGLNALMDRWWSIRPIDHFLAFAGDKAMGWTERFIAHARQGYRAVTGRDMDEVALSLLCDNMRPMARELPLRRLLAALCDYCVSPHHITLEDRDGPYAHIVKRGLGDLRPFVWVCADGAPRRRFADDGAQFAAAGAKGRRRKPAVERKQSAASGKRAVSLSAKRAGRAAGR